MNIYVKELWELIKDEELIYIKNKRNTKGRVDRKTKKKYKERCKGSLNEIKRYLDLIVKQEEGSR